MENVFKKKVSVSFSFHWEYYQQSPIVSLLFLLNGDLLNLWGKSRLIVIAMSLQDFQR